MRTSSLLVLVFICYFESYWLTHSLTLAKLAKDAGNEVLLHWMRDLGTSQDVSFTLCHVVSFSFFAGQCNSFPILPPLIAYSFQCLGSFSPVVESKFVIIVMLIEVSIKCCCIVVWQTKCIQCVRKIIISGFCEGVIFRIDLKHVTLHP